MTSVPVPPKILFLTEIHTPYRQPVLEALCARDEWNLRVALLSPSQKNRSWDLDELPRLRQRTDILPGFQAASIGAHALFVNTGVTNYLKRQAPDLVVISGYAQPAFWQARRFCLARGVPYVTMTESHLRKRRPAWREPLKRALISPFYRNASAHLVTGSAAKRYVSFYGADETRVFFFPNTIDIAAYARRVGEIRSSFSVDPAAFPFPRQGIHILYVGHIERWKGVDLLIRAFRDIASDDGRVMLHLVGDGSMLPALRGAARSVSDRVFFHGFVQPDSLPLFYAASDLFVLPSLAETWGVVVLEAMAAGVPVIASDAAGIVEDLVDEAKTGFRFASGDVVDLISKMKLLLGDLKLRSDIAAAARERAGSWSGDRAVEGFGRAVAACRSGREV